MEKSSSLLYSEESYMIIGSCMKVQSELGHGFLEVVYKDALEIELRLLGIPFQREHCFEIDYRGHSLRHKYYADFKVMDKIIVEAKALDGLPSELMARCINYLKASSYKLCLLVNFGTPNLQWQRIVL
ncbi:MAG: GxxExxY protein [Saprospiraceae bacterium]|nr:GxxExxY protein [Saprospiraceae bacterium]